MARFNAPILLFISLCCLLFTVPVMSEMEAQWQAYRIGCQVKTGNGILNAIDRFCKKNLHVPSNQADFGEVFQSKPRNIISIYGDQKCFDDGRMNDNSNVWVPQYWCERQFWKVCAYGNNKGRGNMNFGGRGCQVFDITDFPN
jgi:hypothetical protein